VAGPGNPGSRIVLRATLESWVRVTGPDNELLLEKFLRPGDVYTVPDRFGLLLTTGNAGGIEISVEGRIAPALGPIGAVRRNVVLDPEKLLAGTTLTP
jgi:cytoskeleton protein RodZ